MAQNIDFTGNAQLVTFGGGVPAYGSYNPNGLKSSTATSLGNTMSDTGTLNLQLNSGLTVSGAGLSSTSVDIAVAVYQLPASSLDQFGRGININAGGSVLTTTASAKRFKIFVSNNTLSVGSIVTSTAAVIVIADSSAVSVTTGGQGWQLTANLYKTGTAGSNTQLAVHESGQVGLTPSGLQAPSSLTLTESSTIFIAVTMNEVTVGNTSWNFLQVQGYN